MPIGAGGTASLANPTTTARRPEAFSPANHSNYPRTQSRPMRPQASRPSSESQSRNTGPAPHRQRTSVGQSQNAPDQRATTTRTPLAVTKPKKFAHSYPSTTPNRSTQQRPSEVNGSFGSRHSLTAPNGGGLLSPYKFNGWGTAPAGQADINGKIEQRKRKRGTELQNTPGKMKKPRRSDPVAFNSFKRLEDKPVPTPWRAFMPERPPSLPASSQWLDHLHLEIVAFSRFTMLTPDEVNRRDQVTGQYVQSLESRLKGVQVFRFGSSGTGLALPWSDIDLVIMDGLDLKYYARASLETRLASGEPAFSDGFKFEQQYPMSKSKKRKSLEKIKFSLLQIKSTQCMQLIGHARVPIVKFENGLSGIAFDVCFGQPSGLRTAKIVKDWVETVPGLREMIMVMKQFLLVRGMNDASTGGVGGYGCVVWVLAFFAMRADPAFESLFSSLRSKREELGWHHPCSQQALHFGLIFVEFCLCWTIFDYKTMGVRFVANPDYCRRASMVGASSFDGPDGCYLYPQDVPVTVQLLDKAGTGARAEEFYVLDPLADEDRNVLKSAHCIDEIFKSLSQALDVLAVPYQEWNENQDKSVTVLESLLVVTNGMMAKRCGLAERAVSGVQRSMQSPSRQRVVPAFSDYSKFEFPVPPVFGKSPTALEEPNSGDAYPELVASVMMADGKQGGLSFSESTDGLDAEAASGENSAGHIGAEVVIVPDSDSDDAFVAVEDEDENLEDQEESGGTDETIGVVFDLTEEALTDGQATVGLSAVSPAASSSSSSRASPGHSAGRKANPSPPRRRIAFNARPKEHRRRVTGGGGGGGSGGNSASSSPSGRKWLKHSPSGRHNDR